MYISGENEQHVRTSLLHGLCYDEGGLPAKWLEVAWYSLGLSSNPVVVLCHSLEHGTGNRPLNFGNFSVIVQVTALLPLPCADCARLPAVGFGTPAVLFHPASSILCQVVVLESPMSSSWQRLWAHRPIDARMALITALIYSWPLLFMAFRSLSCCSKLSIVNCHGCFASNPLQCV